MITKEQLSSMQNYEISLLLCELLGYMVTFIHPCHESEMPTINVAGKTLGGFYAVEFGRWDCLMPLAIEHKIDLISLEDGYIAMKCKDVYMEEKYRTLKFCGPSPSDFAHESPQRAIVCCLILLLQEKQNEGQIQTNL